MSREHGPEPASAAAVPSRIGARYEVLEHLGRGGMASVYRVRDRSLGTEFALKQLIRTKGEAARVSRALFDREFATLAQLRHPSIVEVYDYGVDAAGPYYTMEMLGSGDLGVRAPWPCAPICRLMMQICSALSLLHSRQLVHRDISPRNVRITRDGTAKLIDFGAMLAMGPCDHAVGTPGFVAPEVVEHANVDARTDLFSIGATLYHALTGHAPFTARTFVDLADSWRSEPIPPSARAPGVPAALDALVLSLLRLDPAQRPETAFEVMQRLAAIAGTAPPESAEFARAYLATPLLTARERQLAQFRPSLRRTMLADGHGLWFEGDPGLGRSRLLDTCVLEAMTNGVTVLRVAGRASRREEFAAMYTCAEQLLQALPDESRAAAIDTGGASVLLQEPRTELELPQPGALLGLLPLSVLAADRATSQAAMLAWLRRVAVSHALLIAIDDVERIDDSSLAVLVALVHAGSGARLLVLCTGPATIDAAARPVLGLLRAHSRAVALDPLQPEHTALLLSSVFYGVPNVSRVADRVHKVASGNPRESLALVQHMIERGSIRFADGYWVLPAELAVSDLPANADEALALQLENLAALERTLAETQALAFETPWSRTDYEHVAAGANSAEVAYALAGLIRAGIVVQDGGVFTLRHMGVRACLLARLSTLERQRCHAALAELCSRTGRAPLVEVYHLLHAEQFESALARLLPLLAQASTLDALHQQAHVDFAIIGEILERAHACSAALGHRLRERYDLVRWLLEVSVRTDTRYYTRYVPAWRAQLERDSGLSDYRALGAELPGPERLQRALQAAVARYTETAEPERVYRVDEAIPELGRLVGISIGVGARGLDRAMLASLPGLLEPFAMLSPVLYALDQQAMGVTEMDQLGRYAQAHVRYLGVHQCLVHALDPARPDFEILRYGAACVVGMLSVLLGYTTAEHWIAVMEEHAGFRVFAQQLRRALCILDGDLRGAEQARQRAELLTLQSFSPTVFEATPIFDLFVQTHARDLVGLKQTADRLVQYAEKWPDWRPHLCVVQANYHRMRGDLVSALEAIEQALALSNPDQVDPVPSLVAWSHAAALKIEVLAELGELREAHAFGLAACERGRALQVFGLDQQIRHLAIVEARLGDHASAASRLDALIAERKELRPSFRAFDFEARARVAIVAKDLAAAALFAQRATDGSAANGGQHGESLRRRLLDEAQLAGVRLELPLSDFESRLRVSGKPAAKIIRHPELESALRTLPNATARAARALGLLVERFGAKVGHLYYASLARLVRTASLGDADPLLDQFVNGYFQQLRADDPFSTVFTEAPKLASAALPTGTWTSANGRVYRLIPLSPAGANACVGLLTIVGSAKANVSSDDWALCSALSACLLELGDVAAASG